ncbi:MAG: bifunctional riboflavin kinase/FAD synthetase [Actinomycetes bacterium]
MLRWRGFAAVPAGWGRCVVTIGVYDGVHRGHQVTLRHLIDRARAADQPAVVVTFEPHPLTVLRAGTEVPLLTPLGYKAGLLEELGVDALCIVPFTRSFSRLEPDEFAHHMLVANLHAATVVVGANFRFGHRAVGDVGLLAGLGQQYGFSVEAIELAGGETTWSSTYIRSCIEAGDVAAAADALSRPHRVEGVVVRGDRRGRELGFPTANLEPLPMSAIPGDGVYAGWLHLESDRIPAAISIGTNPTFEGRSRRVEAYAIDREDLDLYGAHAAFSFVERLRETVKFDSVDALVAQMTDDVKRSREILLS